MNILQRASWPLLCIGGIGALLVFLPKGVLPLDSVKTLWIVFFIVASLLTTISIALSDKFSGTIKSPPRIITISALLIILATVFSSIFSNHFYKSFLGQGFEVLTGGVIAVAVIAFLLSVVHFRSEHRSTYFLIGISVAFWLLFVLHFLRLFFPELDLGFLTSPTSTLIGKWSDLAVFSGVVLVTSLFYLQNYIDKSRQSASSPESTLLPNNLFYKLAVAKISVASLLVLIFVNFSTAWMSLAMLSGAVLIYEVYRGADKKDFSYLFLVLLIISSFMYVKGGEIVDRGLTKIGVVEKEVTLSLGETMSLAGRSLEKSPFFGTGPNRFLNEYLISKPAGSTVEFLYGSSLAGTLLVTTGIIGVLAWIFFITSILRSAVSNVPKNDHLIVFGIMTLFLWFMLFSYVPSQGILILAFIITGIFTAYLDRAGAFGQDRQIFYKENFQIDKFSADIIKTTILWIIIISSALFIISYLRKTVALGHFQAGINKLFQADLDSAKNSFEKSLIWYENDVYYQALSEVNLLEISSIAMELNSEVGLARTKESNEERNQKVRELFDTAMYNARRAVLYDDEDYYNYLSEARASEIGARLSADGAYENALKSYQGAISRNPNNPDIYLSLARLEADRKNYDKAKSAIGNALKIKPNYVSAVFLLVQIQIAEGKNSEALTSARFLTEISPDDPTAFFQLGLLRYNFKSYQDAITAFAQAVEISPDYANARYFLGLSYSALGKFSDGAKHFEILAESNPDNKEVAYILENLRLGRPAFAGAPLDVPPPEDRPAPPLN